MSLIRIIPERTIDAWTSSAILDREPRALVWAPTPPRRARNGHRPWHPPFGPVDHPGKLLAIQNKALIARMNSISFPKVSIDLGQLARLVDLETQGVPIFYGLPCLWGVHLSDLLLNEDLRAHDLSSLRQRFVRWQRVVRPLEVLAMGPVLKAVAASRRVMTLDTLALVDFSSLRAFLSDTLADPWGLDLPTDQDFRARPLVAVFKPEPIVTEAVRRVACMGPASPSGLRQRLLDLYAEPHARALLEDLGADPTRADLHLGRIMWLVLPTPQPMQDHHQEPIRELALARSSGP